MKGQRSRSQKVSSNEQKEPRHLGRAVSSGCKDKSQDLEKVPRAGILNIICFVPFTGSVLYTHSIMQP